MKKVFERLRRWLIKKLGGYTEQFTPIQRPIVHTETGYPQKVQARICVLKPAPGRERDFKRYCKGKVLGLLVQQLNQEGFILWESTDDAFDGKVNVRATLHVVDPNDLRQCFQTWME